MKQTISALSREMGISARTLRYYEEIGLLTSIRQEEYAYRTYDGEAVERLQCILLLRKLQIPLRQIGEILNDRDAAAAVQIFRQRIAEIDGELSSLAAVREALERLAARIAGKAVLKLPEGEELTALLSDVNIFREQPKEEISMEKIEQANHKLTDVRIVSLPPCTVASIRLDGPEPEDRAISLIARFVMETGLLEKKPDLRQFGFDNPLPDKEGNHGYEVWVTIPPEMEVPAPLVKKQFSGGLYAAHVIPMGAFEEWQWLVEWVEASEQYTFVWDEQRWQRDPGSDAALEETLNYVNRVRKPDDGHCQLDLLLPIREK